MKSNSLIFKQMLDMKDEQIETLKKQLEESKLKEKKKASCSGSNTVYEIFQKSCVLATLFFIPHHR